jgi:hypothetical protein
MANAQDALADPMVLGQSIDSRARSTGKGVVLVSLLLVGAGVGLVLSYGGLNDESVITMPAMKLQTGSSQARMMTLPMQAQAAQGKPAPSLRGVHGLATPASQSTLMSRLNPLTWLERPQVAAAACVYAGGKAPVTKEDVVAVQNAWAGAIERISKVYAEKGDYVGEAAKAAGELYAYGNYDVLFKPTKAAEYQFRPTPESAMSYFVGGKAVDNGYAEDGGFAINGGKGWSKVVYDNHQIVLKGDIGIAMGNYFFTDATSGEESKVEYTFGYERCDDGKVRIFLHHSSVPYKA